jgi:TolB-like protein/Tfp pilus assembly protein PilF
MLEQAIATVEVKRPGTQIDPEAAAARSMTADSLAQQLRGDLDVIALKALAKEPAERYGTAAAMGEDIQRHLQDRPISARAAPISLRARKFVRRNRPLLVVAGVAAALLLGAGAYEIKRAVMVPVSVFAPPPHSIAVLPFVNLSGDKSQEYFSDGLSEEILDSLTRINALQVVARTSSFSFKGKDADIGTIGRKLNVSAVLEGSVRRSGNTVRITTELINAVTGFHLWSKSFDRNLGDLLKLQTEIADAVASALRVTLLGDESARVELGGTHNPAAFDAYLHARKAQLAGHGGEGYQTAIAHFTEAIELDPKYALAFAGRAVALANYGGWVPEQAARPSYEKAHEDALRAIALAPDLAEGHLALAGYFEMGSLDFARANEEYERALALGSGNARVLQDYGQFAVMMGQKEPGIAAVRRAQLLDPLDPTTNDIVGFALVYTREYQEAIAAFQATLTLNPDYSDAYAYRGLAYYAVGNLQGARTSCESKPDFENSHLCLAIVYNKLGRHADAEAQLAKLKASDQDTGAYQYAEIYAQWGDTPKALEWLETALRLHDAGLDQLKSDPFVDPLRNEPRFQAIEKSLRFIG